MAEKKDTTKKVKKSAKKKDAPEKKKKKTVKNEKVVKVVAEETAEEMELAGSKIVKYYEAVGKRKRAVARVRLFTRGDKGFTINEAKYTDYFPTEELRSTADGSLRKMKVVDKFNVSVKVMGGGIHGQAEAVRHGIARALVKFNPDFRKRLKRSGYLRRDPRETERKKFGLKKARRAPQWSKR